MHLVDLTKSNVLLVQAFAAGADIKFMSDKSYMDMHKQRACAHGL